MNVRNTCMAVESTAGIEIQVGDIKLTKANHYCSYWNDVGKKINTYHFLKPCLVITNRVLQSIRQRVCLVWLFDQSCVKIVYESGTLGMMDIEAGYRSSLKETIKKYLGSVAVSFHNR